MKPNLFAIIFNLGFFLVLFNFGLAAYITSAYQGAGDLIINLEYDFEFVKLGPAWHSFYFPIINLAILMVNLFLAQAWHKREPLLAYLIGGFSAFLSLLILIELGVIITIN